MFEDSGRRKTQDGSEPRHERVHEKHDDVRDDQPFDGGAERAGSERVRRVADGRMTSHNDSSYHNAPNQLTWGIRAISSLRAPSRPTRPHRYSGVSESPTCAGAGGFCPPRPDGSGSTPA